MEEKIFHNSIYLQRGIYHYDLKELIIVFKTDEAPLNFYDVPINIWSEIKESDKADWIYRTKIMRKYNFSVCEVHIF